MGAEFCTECLVLVKYSTTTKTKHANTLDVMHILDWIAGAGVPCKILSDIE